LEFHRTSHFLRKNRQKLRIRVYPTIFNAKHLKKSTIMAKLLGLGVRASPWMPSFWESLKSGHWRKLCGMISLDLR
jgi:hypothetical protein